MAKHTDCPVNLLHLSSRLAVEAGKDVSHRYRDIDFLLEATLHHLGLSNDMDLEQNAKVNPPIRSQEDVDYLWKSVIDGTIKTVASDHACPTAGKKTRRFVDLHAGIRWDITNVPILIYRRVP